MIIKMPVDRLVMVDISSYAHGYYATSKALPGLFVSHTSFDSIVKSLPAAIGMLMKAKFKTPFSVVPHKLDQDDIFPANLVAFEATPEQMAA